MRRWRIGALSILIRETTDLRGDAESLRVVLVAPLVPTPYIRPMSAEAALTAAETVHGGRVKRSRIIVICAVACAALMASPFALQAQPVPLDRIPTEPTGTVLPGRVTVDYAEVRAGPGSVYLSRGRVYRGDSIEILRRNETGEWFEIAGGGVHGWVGADAVEVTGGAAASSDPARDRRLTNYEYDDKGRRVRPDGGRLGSGEGVAGEKVDDFARESPGAARNRHAGGSAGVSVWAGIGGGQIRRVFASDIDDPSALERLQAQPSGLAVRLGGSWDAHQYFMVRANGRFALGGETDVRAAPDLGIDEDISLKTQAYAVDVDAVGRYSFGGGWAGVYLGARWLRHAFTETKPFPIFLTNVFTGIGVGVTAVYAPWPELRIGATAGLLEPLTVSQSPADSGELDGSSGLEWGGDVAYTITGPVAVVGAFHWARIKTTFRGDSSHVDTESAAEPKHYAIAEETDTVLGGSLGLRIDL